jgi:TPR repeat protein
MLASLRRLVRSRDPDARLAAALAELERGWSYGAFETVSGLADGGHAVAQFRLARMYETADGVVQNLGDAVHWYRRAAQLGHAPSQARLGLLYSIEPPPPAGVTPDGLEDAQPGGSAAEVVPRLGEALLASFPHGVSVKQDLAEAAKWNRLAAEAGVAEAQARFGHQLAAGQGVGQDLKLAEHYLRAAAAQADATGQAGLGILLAGGYGPCEAADDAEAARWLQLAVEGGNSAAQYWLGQLKLREAAPGEDPRPGLRLLKRAAAQGQTAALYELGMAFWRGDSGATDSSAAETWLRRASARGSLEAMRALGQLLLERPEDDGVEAAGWLRQAAEAGDRPAAALLAEQHLRAHGVPRDLLAAAHWIRVAGGDARPEVVALLAAHHAKGVGAEENYGSAAQWLQVAARRGSIAAQFNLGSLHWQGKGVPQDPVEAEAWFRRAADGGNAQAAFYLGLLHADASCALHDDALAAQWFRRAMDGGHGVALCNLAMLHIRGRGVVRDPARAVRMLETGANTGCVQAAELLVHLFSSGEELAEAPQRTVTHLVQAVVLGSAPAAIITAGIMAESRRRGFDWHPVDRAQLAAALEPAARQGDAAAQRTLGQVLFGAGASRSDAKTDPKSDPKKVAEEDPRAARPWFEAAARAGDAQAQAWMGDCERLGWTGPKDLEAAQQWYRQAAGQGLAGALIELVQLLEATLPRNEENDAECFGLWLTAAAAGEVQAQRTVGTRYIEGKGPALHPGAGVRWLLAAAAQGDGRACFLLGCCFRYGKGVAKDGALAKLWFERAAAQGQQSAGPSPAAAQERLAEAAHPGA